MRVLAKLMAATAIVAMAPAANAAAFFPGDPEFTVSGDPSMGPISANFGLSGIGSGSFTDTFSFIIDQDGLGSGSITSILAGLPGSATDLDFTSVTFDNGTASFPITITDLGFLESGGMANIPISNGALNVLSVSYVSRGSGSYGGNLVFTPDPIPEPATWAMMLMGFGALGSIVRRRRQAETKVSYAF